MPWGTGVLPGDRGSELHVLDEVRAKRTAGMVAYIQPLTFRRESATQHFGAVWDEWAISGLGPIAAIFSALRRFGL